MSNKINNLSKDYLLKLAHQCKTKKEFHEKLNIPVNGTYTRIVNSLFNKYQLKLKPKIPKYEKILKLCPICKLEFETKKNHKNEKTTCSYSCSNTFFRSGKNNPNFKNGNNYRTICFLEHDKICIICGEKNIVSVHHYDENHENNSPDNLVPLCPTHHQYVHSRFRYIIIDQINEYVLSRRKELNLHNSPSQTECLT